ncbi:polysaccharide deacetylase family protein [Patulibacter brassicae]|uniref:Polysaccharide deacetylase family protein n=1 Tax=Patulibacter brassicae TaxID=1705717 RepID=A0ABU4VKE1_9ACTN|nr:polysaccharide deacetylase family protein [Patulibacter brassicae]MDX8152302.1 polysaccharide deacetylase family protein [Patulibacter brassicae]
MVPGDDDDWGWDDEPPEAPTPRAARSADASADGARGDADPPAEDARAPRSSEGRDEDAEDEPAAAPPAASRVPPPGRHRASLLALLAALLVLGTAVALLVDGGDERPAHHAPERFLARQTAAAGRDAAAHLGELAALRRFARNGRPIYCGGARKPMVALTLDDGPWPLSGRFIALLAREHVPVTVFRIGRNVPGREEYVRVERNLGWASGSHTQTHPQLARLSTRDQEDEILAGQRASTRALGRPPMLFRPPYESHDGRTDRILRRHGLVQVLWNVDTQDALGVSASTIAERAIKGLHPGSIILMHEVQENTLKALPRIIRAMRQRGLEPVTVPRMLAEDPPTAEQLRKGFDGCPVDLTPGKAAS